ncbi:MAG: hypothetical protein HZA90_26695 [Verrucomicrobia bacterium]|nr:hypothetical protein [Verrucomicrobiota bacterium]
MKAPWGKRLRRSGRLLGCAALLWAAGCATGPKKTAAIFFPLPPDEPRIQYLTSFSSESDLSEGTSFADFVLGSEKAHRPIWKPYGLTTTPGKLYVCDTQPANVGIIDLNKRKIRYLRPEGQGAMQLPINVAVDKDGTRYVTDTKRCQVLIYGADDSYLGAIGQKGEMKPCGIALAGDRLLVTDLSNHCVRVYAKANRELLFTVPRTTDEKARLYQPTNLAVDDQGRIYVSDTGGYAAQVYGPDGTHLRSIGQMGLTPGNFVRPKGIGVDRQGRVYVVDAAITVVQVFDNEGRTLMFFGEPATSGKGALYLPAGLAIDYDNVHLFQKHAAPGYKIEFLIFVANQAGPRKVNVYGFLQKG